MNEHNVRYIAIYLPQFHPVEINDKIWGKGFTEWTNVARAKPLFKGHYQPRIPRDLGFYDLRLPEIRDEQAKMAKEAGIEGFCYWHYWFGNGVMTLEKPLQDLIESKKPNYPFCVGWANHSWSTSTWNAIRKESKASIFLEQKYPGMEDIIQHFNYLLPAFRDARYMKIDGKPIFMVFDPLSLPSANDFIKIWNECAKKNGFDGIYFIARMETADVHDTKRQIRRGNNAIEKYNKFIEQGFDGVYTVPVQAIKTLDSNACITFFRKILQRLGINFLVEKHNYSKILKYMFTDLDYKENVYPQIMPHWDNTPRRGINGYVYTNESPMLFGKQIDMAVQHVKNKQQDHKIVFINSWNEWGEGNYLEPDLKYENAYLNELRKRK